MKILVPAVRRGNDYIIVPHVARSPSFVLVEVGEAGEHKIVAEVENPFTSIPERRGEKVAELIASLKPEAVIVRGIGPGMRLRLEGSGIRVHMVEEDSLEKALTRFAGTG